MLYSQPIKFKIVHCIFPISLMFPKLKKTGESTRLVVCSSRWIFVRKTYFNLGVEAL